MGYTTDFFGKFSFNKPLLKEHITYINKLSETRRMKRNADIAANMNDPIREAVRLPIGFEAEYFVGGGGFAGQEHDSSIIDYNGSPSVQPGLWCKWCISSCGNFLEWDGAEKFYRYVEWLEYLIENFFERWGYILNGEVEFQGEDPKDKGIIICKDNKVRKIIYHERPRK